MSGSTLDIDPENQREKQEINIYELGGAYHRVDKQLCMGEVDKHENWVSPWILSNQRP